MPPHSLPRLPYSGYKLIGRRCLYFFYKCLCITSNTCFFYLQSFILAPPHSPTRLPYSEYKLIGRRRLYFFYKCLCITSNTCFFYLQSFILAPPHSPIRLLYSEYKLNLLLIQEAAVTIWIVTAAPLLGNHIFISRRF